MPANATLASPSAGDNFRGACLMALAMALFAVEDALIKTATARLPVGEILIVLGTGGAILFGALTAVRDGRPVQWRNRAVLARTGAEAVGTMCFVTSLALVPLATASAILQAAPLAVTLGAALVLREPVGWRRWSAVIVGFMGVLVIVRPGLEGFVPASLFAVAGVLGLAARDIATRRVPADVPSHQLSALAFASTVPAGMVLLWLFDAELVRPSVGQAGLLAATLAIGMVAYATIVAATRIGEAAAIAPFRYARIVFALILATLIFGERPDAATLLGCAIIVASGLYTFWREAQLRRGPAARTAPQSAGGVGDPHHG